MGYVLIGLLIWLLLGAIIAPLVGRWLKSRLEDL